ARLPDPSLTVDERELAEPRRALVLRAPGAQNVGARLRFDLDDASRLEADAQAAHDRAAYVERLRRRDDTVGALRVRCGEDLLGRQVRDVLDAVDGGRAASGKAGGRKQPDREV